MQIQGEAKLLRIFLGENDKSGSIPVYEKIVVEARKSGLAGATVFKGIMGFGGNSRIHTSKILRLSEDLPYSESVDLSARPFQHVKEFGNGILIVNPPYGMRLGELEEVKALYKELGDFIKTNCNGTTAFIYTGSPELRKSIGLKTTKRIPLDNGKLEGVLVQIDSYKGTKKKQWDDNDSRSTD